MTQGRQRPDEKVKPPANIFQNENDDNEGEPFLRTDLLDLIELAGLTHALLTFIQRHPHQLEKAGADAEILNTMRLQEFRHSFFTHTPKAVVDKLLEELSHHSKKQLDKFIEKHPDNTELHLVKHLAVLRLHMLDPVIQITSERERARCLIACIADSKHKAVAAAVGSLQLNNPEVKHDRLLSLAVLPIECPEQALASDLEIDLNILVASCSVAIRLGERETAHKLLMKIKQHEQNLPDHERAYGVLQDEYQKALPQFKDATHLVKRNGTQKFSSSEGLEVLATCNKVIRSGKNRQQSAFSRVLAVRADEDSEWLALNQNERTRLFPNQGSIIHLEGHSYPQIPKYRSYSVWEVKSRVIDERVKQKHNTLLHAHRKIRTAHEALTLEHISSVERAKAREWLRAKDFSEHADGEVVLRFSDNLFVKPLQTNHMLIADKFNQSLLCWKSLPLLHFQENGKYIYVGDLPNAGQEYSLLTPEQEIAQQLEQLDGNKTHEKEKFIEALNNIGSNQSVHVRAAEIDPTKYKYEKDEIEELARLLAQTEEHLAELSLSYESELSADRQELAEHRQEYEKLVKLDEQVQMEMDKQQKMATSMESIIEARIDNFLKLASEKDDGLSTIVLLRKIDELSGRVKSLEGQLAKKPATKV